jgi:hypothetical protein
VKKKEGKEKKNNNGHVQNDADDDASVWIRFALTHAHG